MLVERLITASTARVSSRAYGSAARCCCWARTIREDAISSWARVILAMDWTVLIRCLTRRSWAAISLALVLARRGHAPGDGLLALVLQRLGLLVLAGQHLARAGLERLAELLDRVLERGDRILGQVLRLPDRGQDALVRAPQVLQEVVLEPADVLQRHIVQVAVAARPDRDHLVLDRERVVLRLLEPLAPARPP